MALRHLQSVLARLYVDSEYRARFFADRDAAVREHALSEEERLQLRALDRAQVERFARSLASKRISTVREYLPATSRAVGDLLSTLFIRYSDSHPSVPDRLPDAIEFARFLETATAPPGASRGELTAWQRNLARLERVRLEILNSWHEPAVASRDLNSGHLRLTALARVEAFDFDLAEWYERAMSQTIAPPPETPCWLLVGRKSGVLRVRVRRVNEITARILRMCDGTRALPQINREAGAVLGLNATQCLQLAGETEGMLRPLLQAGLIEVC